MKDVNYYLGLPWSYLIRTEQDTKNTDPYFFIRVVQLDCYSDGKTLNEAVDNIQEALKAHIEACIEAGVEIQEPLKESDFKGNFSIRTTPEKHFSLAVVSQETKKPVNTLVNEAIDIVIGRR